jgi:hypothetical protein
MTRFILTVAAVAFAAVLGSTTNLYATSHHGGGHVAVHAHVVAHPAHIVHRPVGNYRFHERGYRGWVSRCWFGSYGCYGYYCGADQLWYYWYAPFNEYLPTSYMSVYPPTQCGVAPVNVVQVTPGMPALPPGATQVPGPITAP